MELTSGSAAKMVFAELAQAGTMFRVQAVDPGTRWVPLMLTLEALDGSGESITCDREVLYRSSIKIVSPLMRGDLVRFEHVPLTPLPGTRLSLMVKRREPTRSLGTDDIGRTFIVERIDPKDWSTRGGSPRRIVLTPPGDANAQRVVITRDDLDSRLVAEDLDDRGVAEGDVVAVDGCPAKCPWDPYLFSLRKPNAAQVVHARKKTKR